jgi:hypothetical protein
MLWQRSRRRKRRIPDLPEDAKNSAFSRGGPCKTRLKNPRKEGSGPFRGASGGHRATDFSRPSGTPPEPEDSREPGPPRAPADGANCGARPAATPTGPRAPTLGRYAARGFPSAWGWDSVHRPPIDRLGATDRSSRRAKARSSASGCLHVRSHRGVFAGSTGKQTGGRVVPGAPRRPLRPYGKRSCSLTASSAASGAAGEVWQRAGGSSVAQRRRNRTSPSRQTLAERLHVAGG